MIQEWICRTCKKVNSIFIGKCSCGEVFVDKMGTTDWYSYYHCEIRAEEETGNIAIFIPLTCQHLNFNPETGMAVCLIYNDRPQICREYLCEAAKNES
jgi:hypothetical protein